MGLSQRARAWLDNELRMKAAAKREAEREQQHRDPGDLRAQRDPVPPSVECGVHRADHASLPAQALAVLSMYPKPRLVWMSGSVEC